MWFNWSKRDWIIFCAGAQVFHTLSHMLLGVSGSLPLHIFSLNFTPEWNMAAILLNVVVACWLLWWASKVR